MVEHSEGQIHEEQLTSLGLFSLEKKRLRGDIIPVYNFLKEDRWGTGGDLLFPVISDRSQGNGMKQCQGKFRQDIGFCSFRWEGGQSLEDVPWGSGHALSHMIEFYVFPWGAGSWTQWSLWVPFNLRYFTISCILCLQYVVWHEKNILSLSREIKHLLFCNRILGDFLVLRMVWDFRCLYTQFSFPKPFISSLVGFSEASILLNPSISLLFS